MPAFNITPRKKYLAVEFQSYLQTNSFKEACEFADNCAIYERLGNPHGKTVDWYILATVDEKEVCSEIIGDLPND